MTNCVTLFEDDGDDVPGVLEGRLHRGEIGAPGTSSPPDVKRNLGKLIEFMGGAVQTVKLRNDENLGRLRDLIPVRGCVMAHARTITPKLRTLLLKQKAQVLVYGFDSAQSQLSEILPGGSVAPIETQDAVQLSVADCREVCGQMAGLVFDAMGVPIRSVFNTGNFTPLLSIGQRPFFVRTHPQGCLWMLLAGDDIADLDAVLHKKASILHFFPGVAPVMMFLRTALPERFWHNNAPTACFILDDPPLKERYGFLNYKKLMALKDHNQFSINIAFIPWNFRRSQNRVVEMFLRNPDTCSLSVHGCDHTRGEFGSPDFHLMRKTAQRALDRMTQHREITGLGFDDVMVFPQGIFSTNAMKALKACGYLAAVNSTAHPVDTKQDLALRDHLGLAVTRFSDFPLFTRRYPRHLAQLAFDLFLGKPALIVEHHSFLRDNGKALSETVEKVNRLDARLLWTNLASCCSESSLQKTEANGDISVRFVTDRFVLQNKTGQTQTYILSQQNTPDLGMLSVIVNDRQAQFESDPDGIKIRVKLNANQNARIRIERERPHLMNQCQNVHWTHQLKVFLRRRLCDFRDNYVATTRALIFSPRNKEQV